MPEAKDTVCAGVRGLWGLFPRLVELAGLMEKGVLRPDPALSDETRRRLTKVRRSAEGICRQLTGSAAEDPSFFRYVSLPGHMERICDHFENLSGLLRMKAVGDIHFSDKAADEMHCMFRRLGELLSVLAGDASAAGGSGVKETWILMRKSAGEFAAIHDERLREGICLPKAHAVYLGMLEEIKAIAWHLKKMARDLPAA